MESAHQSKPMFHRQMADRHWLYSNLLLTTTTDKWFTVSG